jgi:hypothetical protein
MRSFSLLPVVLLGLTQSQSVTAYTLVDNFQASNFFPNFDFFTGADPTHGFVQYVNEATARNTGLIAVNPQPDGSQRAYMGVDHANVTPNGRPSVRVSSKKTYNHGLFIADFAHIPEGCGTWPAYWLLGPDWPNGGEVDIVEGVHVQTQNSMALHTSAGCSINNSGFTGQLQTANCDVNAPGQAANAGCGITVNGPNSYGSGFNSAGGGVYATQWTPDFIKIWFFSRANGIPADIRNGDPKPATWGTPAASFQGACNIDAHFRDMRIIFDTTFCGDWAGSVWGTTACKGRAATCEDFVKNQPGEFKGTYFAVNSMKVYQ